MPVDYIFLAGTAFLHNWSYYEEWCNSHGSGFITFDVLVVGVTVLIFNFIFEVVGGSRCFLCIAVEEAQLYWQDVLVI
jgi:hypothetical protein